MDFFHQPLEAIPGNFGGYRNFPPLKHPIFSKKLPLLLHKKPEIAAGDFCLQCTSAESGEKYKLPRA